MNRSVVVSYVNDEMVVTEKEGVFQAATNFYLHDVPFEYEKQGEDRYAILADTLTQKTVFSLLRRVWSFSMQFQSRAQSLMKRAEYIQHIGHQFMTFQPQHLPFVLTDIMKTAIHIR